MLGIDSDTTTPEAPKKKNKKKKKTKRAKVTNASLGKNSKRNH
jgi:hypothetical protein